MLFLLEEGGDVGKRRGKQNPTQEVKLPFKKSHYKEAIAYYETPAPPTAEEATLEALAEQGERIEELKNHILTLMEAMAEREES